jgi:hypothetical protein
MIPSLLLIAVLATGSLQAQDLAREALKSFPRDTIRVEFSSPARLRAVPNYSALRERYIGGRLRTLEDSLANLGVRESDVSELLLGWRAGTGDMDLYGLATGTFDAKAIRQKAANRGLSPTSIEGQEGYCLEAGIAGNCAVVIGSSRGVFGPLGVLSPLLEARNGQAPALGSEERFAKLVEEMNKSGSPIWGVAVGAAVGDWFTGWMPSQDSLQLDWSRTFAAVEALAYNAQATDKVDLKVGLDCTTPEGAANLRQVLEGVRLFQQIAWQNQNPDRPNPFESLQVALKDRRVNLSLVTTYDAVGAGGSSARR